MNSTSMIRALWRLLDRRRRRRLAALQLVSVLMAVFTVSGIAAVLPFFTVLAEPDAIGRNATLHFFYERLHFGNERAFVIALGLAFAGFVILTNLINLLGSLAMYRFAYEVGDSFQVSLFDEYLRRGYGFHSRTNSSVLSTNVLYETARVTGGILQSGLTLVACLVTIVFIVASMVFLNPRVAVSAIAAFGASYTAIYLVVRGRLLQNGLTESRYFAQRSKIVAESFGAIKEIIVLQAYGFFVRRFARCCKPMSASIVSTMSISQTPRYVLEVVTLCSLVAAALYLSATTAGAGSWIAQLSFIGLGTYRLLPALQQAFSAIVRIRAERPAFENIAADLRLAQERGRAAVATTIDTAWRGRPRHDIRLEAVSLRHAPGRPAAISQITLRISAGSIVGLIGANGSGKTTLADVLAGLLVPESGQVQVDGIVLDDSNRAAWQSTVAYVPQHIYLLDATLAENIALGIPTAQIDQERLRTAVRLAQLEECVAALPGRYDEVLGEQGCRLSGGQRQRLGIARALYRNASVLIMDEATNALDAAAEQEIADVLVPLGLERTIILIAHRLSSLRHCDVIFELQNGRIVRLGYPGQPSPPAGAPATDLYASRHTAR